MVDLVIELVLIFAIVVPMVATSLQPARALSRSCSATPSHRRGH